MNDFEKLINVSDLIKWIIKTYPDWYMGAVRSIVDHVVDMPSVQSEIIRCKDCKHQPFNSEDTQGFGVEFPDGKCPCQCDDSWYNWRPNNEWFCGNAERRNNG